MTVFRRLSLLALVTSLIQIASGGLVRATGSGDGCPDWPRCFGRWIPPFEHHALIEYSHRLNASIAILAVMATVVVALARHRRERRIVVPSVVAAFTIVGLAGIGAAVVKSGLNETTVTIHIAIAMALIGTLTYATVNAFCLERFAAGKVKEPVAPGIARLAMASAVGTFLLILAGAYVRGENAGLAFPDWPLMNGRLIPDLQGLAVPHFVHRVAALGVGILLAAFVVKALRARPRDTAVSAFAVVAAGLFVVQSFVGALQVWSWLAATPVALHVALSSLIWAALVAAFTVTRRLAACALPLHETERAGTKEERWETAPAETGPAKMESGREENTEPVSARAEHAGGRRAGRLGSVRAYVRLTKPRIVELLLVTTVPTMILAERGVPSLWLMFATVFGGALAAGSANTINMYFDRDIDSMMGRTRARPLPAHQVEPARALVFGVVLAVVSFAFMTATVNVLSAVLTQAAVLFYVLVYTLVLKRSTPHNIVIGGAAGCVPVLVGWSAVTGTVGWEAVVLFAIVFFWTPAHFWALAMRYAKDYAAAGVPMLPVVAGARETQRQIMLYSFATVAVTLLLTPVAGMGAIYLTAAAFLGGWLIRHAVELRRRGTPQAAMRMFRCSISYLALLFASMGVDTVVHIAT